MFGFDTEVSTPVMPSPAAPVKIASPKVAPALVDSYTAYSMFPGEVVRAPIASTRSTTPRSTNTSATCKPARLPPATCQPHALSSVYTSCWSPFRAKIRCRGGRLI